jgi:hypothetical protein
LRERFFKQEVAIIGKTCFPICGRFIEKKITVGATGSGGHRECGSHGNARPFSDFAEILSDYG